MIVLVSSLLRYCCVWEACILNQLSAIFIRHLLFHHICSNLWKLIVSLISFIPKGNASNDSYFGWQWRANVFEYSLLKQLILYCVLTFLASYDPCKGLVYHFFLLLIAFFLLLGAGILHSEVRHGSTSNVVWKHRPVWWLDAVKRWSSRKMNTFLRKIKWHCLECEVGLWVNLL